MAESNIDKFLRLAGEKKDIENQMKELALQFLTNDTRELLFGGNGLFVEDQKEQMADWLISPRWEFQGKSPAELILDGRAQEVMDFVGKLVAGVYF